MSTGESDSSAREQRANEAVAAYLEAVDAGESPDPEEFVAQHGDVAAELEAFFANRAEFERLAEPLKPAAVEATRPTPNDQANSKSTSALGPGSKLRYFGDYELLEEIARGGMGVVYKARQATLKRVVALKMILSGQLAGEEDVKRFYAEAEAAAKLDHPNIVPIFEIGQHEGQHYFSMAFIEGESLARKVVAGPLPPREAAQLMKKVAEAVTYAHIEGVVHRDLKPANVLLDKDGEPRVTDFGLAKRISAESLSSEAAESAANLTATGQILGTPSYMPPEQAAGKSDEVGALADVYSLGAMLYCLLTGRPPFQAASPLDTLIQVLEKEPVPLRQLDPKISRDLETICLKCLEKEPRKRYQTANELVGELQRFLDGKPIHARPVSRRERFRRWCKRNPIVSKLSAALAVALIVGFGGITWQWIRAEKETDRAVQQEQLTRRYLYTAHVNLAQQAIERGNMLRANELLNQHKPRAGEEDLRSFDWYYLWRQCHRERKTVRLADDGDRYHVDVSNDDVAVSPNGRFVAIGGEHHGAYPHVEEVRLWDVAAERIARVFRVKETRRIQSLVFSPDSTTLAVHAIGDGDGGGTSDQQIIVWNVETGEQLTTLDLGGTLFPPETSATGTRPPYSLSSGGRLLAAVGHWKASEGVKLWEIPAPQEGTKPANGKDASSAKLVTFKSFEGQRYSSYALLLSPDGKWLAWGQGPTKVLSDLTSDAEPIVLDASQVLAFSPEGRWVLTLRHDREANDTVLEIRECATGQLHRAFEVDIRGMAAAAAFSPNGRLLAFSNDELVGLWDIESGEKLVTLKGHTSDVASVAFSQDGRSVISVARTGLEANGPYEAKVWDVDTRYEPETFVAGEYGLTALAVSPTGDLLATASDWRDKSGVRIWDLSSGNFDEPLLVLKANSAFNVQRLAFGPQGKLLVASGKLDIGGRVITDHLQLWRLNRKGQGFHAERLDSLYTPRVTSEDKNPVVSPDGKLVAYVSLTSTPRGNGGGRRYGPQTLRLLDVNSGQQRQIPKDVEDWFEYKEAIGQMGAGYHVYDSAFSPDGTRIATTHGSYIAIWDVATGEAIAAFGYREMLFKSPSRITYSPDGQTLATIHDDNSVMLWDVSQATLQYVRQELERRHNRYFDPEIGVYGNTGIYGPVDTTPIVSPKAILRGHAEQIQAVAFFADGKTLATGGKDRTVRIWDAATGEQRLVLTGHRSHVHSVAITPDGRTLISGSDLGTVRLWRAGGRDDFPE